MNTSLFSKVARRLRVMYESQFCQRSFHSSKGDIIHYVLKKHKTSKQLIVVFSGFNGHYVKGRYNYISSLKHINANKLYIRDDCGFYGVGTYYLGEKGQWWINRSVFELIDYCKGITCSKTVITVGSSKGGTCAMLYGLTLNADYIFAGSPQYEPANYLYNLDKGKDDYGKQVLSEMVSEEKGITKEYIDGLLRNAISKASFEGVLYLMYSTKEPSWKRSINRMVDQLKSQRMNIILDDRQFTRHDDIAVLFRDHISELLMKYVIEK